MGTMHDPARENFPTMVEIALEELGLKKFAKVGEGIDDGSKVYTVRTDHGFEHKVDVIMTFSVSQKTMNSGFKELVDEFRGNVEEMRAAVLASPATKSLTDKIAELEIKLKNRMREVELLAPYETHYKMQFWMQHGKELEK